MRGEKLEEETMRKLRLGFALAGAAGVIITAVACGAQEQTGTWTVIGTMPYPRSEIAAAQTNGKIYILGGHIPGTQATMFTQEYDPATGEWRELEFMPYVASHGGAAAIGNKIYHVGGFVANVHVGAIDRVYEFDTETEQWRQIASLSAPRGSPGVVALDGKIHAIGGRNPQLQTVTTHEVYDPATDTWTMAAPLPVARDHLGIAVLDGKIHVFGGRIGDTSEPVAEHDVYDPATDTWSQAGQLNVPRSAGPAFVLDGKIYYAGGECKTPNEEVRRTFDEVEAYDPATDAWTELPLMPEGRHATASAVVGNRALVFGGSAGCGGDLRRDTVLAYELN
jgi:N-acetylneuraminic acid mutarotase